MTRAQKIIQKTIDLQEASARRTVSFRGGSRHIRFKCQPGYKKKTGSNTCVRIEASKRMQMSRTLKRSWRKRRAHMAHQHIAASRTLRKMRAAGYRPGRR